MHDLFTAYHEASEALPHMRIMASAGSGKTHQLANRYIRLVLEGVDPARILASTFTRLAAGEIQHKILKRLIDAVGSESELQELRRQLNMQSLTSGDVVTAIRRMVQQMHRLNIRTLDSFFAGVATAFGSELGIPPGSTIVEEERAIGVRSEAIRRMLDEREPDAIIELLRRLTQGASDPGVTRSIDRVVTNLYHISRESDPEAWARIPACPGTLSQSALIDAAEALRAIDVPKALARSHGCIQKLIAQRDWMKLLETGYTSKLAAGETLFSRTEIPPDLIEAAMPIVHHMRAVLVNNWRAECIATREVLDLFDTQYQQRKREQGMLTFDDLAAAMRRAVELENLSDLWFRLDASIDHMLLDEFQDTSVQQWDALRPLIAEIVSFAPPERSFFCVGDVKQSIYGWRGAAPEILDQLPSLLGRDDGETIRTEPLVRSWRSAQPIIDVVNRVFGSLESNSAMKKYPNVAATWTHSFSEHSTHLAGLAGRVELQINEYASKKDERNRQRCRRAAELVSELHGQHPTASIAVLTRKNSMTSQLLRALGPGGHGLPCSGRGGGSLIDAPAVVAILDLLRVAQFPDHTVAAFNVATSPLDQAIDQGDQLVRSKGARRRNAHAVRMRLASDGYAVTIGKLMQILTPAVDERQYRRLLQLVDVAEQFDRDGVGDAADFIRIAEQIVVPETRPAPIQVMNIHQSKGLQFDIVILPELDEQLSSQRASVVVERHDETGPVHTVVRRRDAKIRQFVPELEPAFEKHCEREARESLCLLYVAMTRARQGLFILVDELSKKKQYSGTMSGVILAALKPDPATHRLDAPAFVAGSALAITRKKNDVVPAPSSTPFRRPLIDPGVARPGSRAPSPSTELRPHRLAARLALPDTDAIDRGLLIHAWFEAIEWIDDTPIDNSSLRAIGSRFFPRRSAKWLDNCIAEFRASLQNPQIHRLLSHGDRDIARCEVRREWPFVQLVDGRVRQGSIDRLVIERDTAGAVCRAEVTDFKSDRIAANHVVSTAEKYHGQLAIYGRVVAELFDVDPTQIQMTIAFVDPGICVEMTLHELDSE